jgi:hypothetical protein
MTITATDGAALPGMKRGKLVEPGNVWNGSQAQQQRGMPIAVEFIAALPGSSLITPVPRLRSQCSTEVTRRIER